jgi:hypothetical protein
LKKICNLGFAFVAISANALKDAIHLYVNWILRSYQQGGFRRELTSHHELSIVTGCLWGLELSTAISAAELEDNETHCTGLTI